MARNPLIFDAVLQDLARALVLEAQTATELAAAFGVSKQTIYNRLRALEDRGYLLETELVPSKSGPLSKRYSLTVAPG